MAQNFNYIKNISSYLQNNDLQVWIQKGAYTLKNKFQIFC